MCFLKIKNRDGALRVNCKLPINTSWFCNLSPPSENTVFRIMVLTALEYQVFL